jgi:glycerol-3-phosphate cytidylyltransferase-like family protein
VYWTSSTNKKKGERSVMDKQTRVLINEIIDDKLNYMDTRFENTTFEYKQKFLDRTHHEMILLMRLAYHSEPFLYEKAQRVAVECLALEMKLKNLAK